MLFTSRVVTNFIGLLNFDPTVPNAGSNFTMIQNASGRELDPNPIESIDICSITQFIAIYL